MADVERIRLVDLEDEFGPEIEMPSGTAVRVRYFDAPHTQLYVEAVRSGQMSDDDAYKMLGYALPGIDGAELRTLSAKMIWFVGQVANRRTDLVMSMLRKNVERSPSASSGSPPAPAADASAPGASTRVTKSRTRSPASGRSRAVTGGP